MKWNPIKSLAEGIVKPVAGAIADVKVKKEETKQIREKANAGEKLAKSEWEIISKKNEKNTLKDEFITGVWTMPIITLIFAGILSGIWPEMWQPVFDQTLAVIDTINGIFKPHTDNSLSYGQILLIVTLSALSIKGAIDFFKK